MIGEKTIYDKVMLTTLEDIVVYYYKNGNHRELIGIKWEKLDNVNGGWYECQ